MIQSRLAHWLLAGTLAAAAAVTACSSSEQPHAENPANSGEVQLELHASNGVFLDTVDYVITGPGNFQKSGSLGLTHSNTLTARIGGIPLGSGYTLRLDAIGRDDSATCTGSKSFDVLSTGTTNVAISLQCKVKPRTGTVLVNGAINVCPVIENATASLAEINVGFPLELSSSGSDPDGGPQALSYTWSASSGTLSNPNGKIRPLLAPRSVRPRSRSPFPMATRAPTRARSISPAPKLPDSSNPSA